MTLIEVLAATVVLAILSSVCASLLRSVPAMTTLSATDAASIDMMALDDAADDLLADASLRERLVADASGELLMPWPGLPARASIRIRRVEHESTAEKPSHAWLAFSCEEFLIWRRIELPRENPAP
ncbi:MAG: hypothetical protein IT430_20430 [Phycisphaerales bacterium]|nr:hypothetical protein [Phycisphaerales bacterium]